MDVVGSEIGQKMRSAIKAKLTELGCYVDDELPDYVMVMVANKRTRAQMEDDLQLFLGDNTELFVNWLHQVLKKLQEVTVPPIKEPEKVKENVKEKKLKDKKDKVKAKLKKTELKTVKKAKKKEKDKEKLRKKEEKKAHKSKKKSKKHEIIRPNVPPLLMNIEKESEPSITDVFAGQILKNHGVIIDTPKEEKLEQKPVIQDIKRPILPIIDPATISQPEVVDTSTDPQDGNPSISGAAAPREEQIKEINEIEAKIQGLKQKLADQLDSMSDDEDFLNIRTEAEELMNDFAEDVFQEISSQAPEVATPPIPEKSLYSPPIPKTLESKEPGKNKDPHEDTSKKLYHPKAQEPEVLPQIELKLPKRSVRERLGAREEMKILDVPSAKEKENSAIRDRKRTESPERFTPERDPDFWGNYKSSAKSRLGDPAEPARKSPITTKRSSSEDSEFDSGSKKARRVSSSSSERPRVSCASVVRVRPRPRVAPSSSLLLRAVADAHKSLLNIPPKVDVEPSKVKRALVLPMRRAEPQNIVIQVPTGGQDDNKHKSDIHRDEYVPAPLSRKFTNTDYVPSRRFDRSDRLDRPDRPDRADRTTSRRDDTLIIETINIHNTTVDKDKDTQFIVTMDGFNANALLAKKLKAEGLLDEEDIANKPTKSASKAKSVLKTAETAEPKDNVSNESKDKKMEEKEKRKDKENKLDKDNLDKDNLDKEKKQGKENVDKTVEKKTESPPKKRLSDTSDDSDTQVIIKPADKEKEGSLERVEKRKSIETTKENTNIEESPPVKKRKASPIVFSVAKKDKEDAERARQRTESAGSDSHVVVTTAASAHKYDTVPPLSQTEKKLVWCRSFPLCRYGAQCVFQHPRCKFAAACTRRGCPYAHGGPAPPTPPPPPPPLARPIQASTVVPTPNYKCISTAAPSVCKYYPSCVNPACHFYHPKPCRYGKACANKIECNFYHNDAPAKWR